VDEAVALAVKANRQVQTSALGIQKAQEQTTELRTARLPQLSVNFLGGTTLNTVASTIPEGSLGTYPGIGPIPGQDAKIETPAGQFSAFTFASASQPLVQLYKINLGVRQSKLGEDVARESLRQQQQETALQVKSAYYGIADTQSQIESGEASLKYLTELSGLTDRRFSEQTVLKSDVLSVKAKITQQRYQLLVLRDNLQSQKENLNDLLGRDLQTDYNIQPQPAPSAEELDLNAARQKALAQRPEVRKARLQVAKTDLEVRREKAKYLPDVSVDVTYLALTNLSLLPSNIAHAGFHLQWDPFDWGQKKDRIEQLRTEGKQDALTQTNTEQQVLLQVNSTYRKLLEARVSLDTEAAVRELEREKLRVVMNRFEQKSALLSEVLEQQAAVTEADTRYQRALENLWTAKANFEQALGED
jgi:outer membrane protein TolC